MAVSFCSQTILQKSAIVFLSGPSVWQQHDGTHSEQDWSQLSLTLCCNVGVFPVVTLLLVIKPSSSSDLATTSAYIDNTGIDVVTSLTRLSLLQNNPWKVILKAKVLSYFWLPILYNCMAGDIICPSFHSHGKMFSNLFLLSLCFSFAAVYVEVCLVGRHCSVDNIEQCHNNS